MNKSNFSSEQLAHMNARKREKRENLWNNRKPSKKSEWVALSELLVSWSIDSDSISIDDFGIKYNYGPHRIAKWTDDSPEFAEAWEKATYNVLQRRNKAWRDPDKLLNRSLALYDWRIRDYEEKQAALKLEKSHLSSSIPIELYQPLIDAIKPKTDKDKE